MNCEHNIKLFSYDQVKKAKSMKALEAKVLETHLRIYFLNDTLFSEHERFTAYSTQQLYLNERESKLQEYTGFYQGGWEHMIEPELEKLGLTPIKSEDLLFSEEELVMSFMVRQVEMRVTLENDYDNLVTTTETMAGKLMEGIQLYNADEKNLVIESGSLFKQHRETIQRHADALVVTIQRVRAKLNDGFKLLQAKIDGFEYDVEKAAEEEIVNDK